MNHLRNLLQSKYFILLASILILVRVIYSLNNISYDEGRLGNDKTVSGVIKHINSKNSSIEIDNTIIFTDDLFELGSEVECRGEVLIPNSNTNFNLFNYRRYLLSKQIKYQMFGECSLINDNSNILYKIKNDIIKRIDKRNSREYLKAFMLGDTSSIDDGVMESYRYNGVSHLFAISGMHVTFLITLISFLNVKDKTIILLLPLLIFYLFLANFPPSMLRAGSFFVLTYINKKSKLELKSIYLFIYLTLIFLLYNPYYLYSTGFIYSFTISFFLILYRDIYASEKKKFKQSILLTTIVFIVSIPINIQNNFYINLATPLYNLFFIPLVTFILFPAALIVFLFPIFDNLYNNLWIIVETISNSLSHVPSIMVLAHMNIVIILLYYIIIFFILHKMRFQEYKYIVLIFLVMIIHYLYPYFRSDSIVLMLDVGQGDSILIISPRSRLVILVDTGGKLGSDNIVSNITIPTLYSLGITRIDYLVITHGDYDHIGEANNLIDSFKVKNVLMNSGSLTELEKEFIVNLNRMNINYRHISEHTITDGDINLNFLNKIHENENEDSLVLLLEIRKHKLLLMGDSGLSAEEYILSEYNISDVDILKVGHHGSKNSSGDNFISITNPSIALISAGNNNIYRHPHSETLIKLQFCDTYITSIDGAIKISIGRSMLVHRVR